MSKQGIYDRLTSDAGEKFPEDAAQYAIDNLKVDYKKNALEKLRIMQINKICLMMQFLINSLLATVKVHARRGAICYRSFK